MKPYIPTEHLAREFDRYFEAAVGWACVTVLSVVAVAVYVVVT